MSKRPLEMRNTEKDTQAKATIDIEEVEVVQTTPSLQVGSQNADCCSVDHPPLVLTPAEEKRLYRKIDWRLMPILTLLQLSSFLDRCTCCAIYCRIPLTREIANIGKGSARVTSSSKLIENRQCEAPRADNAA